MKKRHSIVAPIAASSSSRVFATLATGVKRLNLKLLYLVLIGLGAPLGAMAYDESTFTSDTLFIEAEDADFDHGQFVTGVHIGMDGPYAGGSYTNLGSANDLDFDWHATLEGSFATDGVVYRVNTGLNGGKEKGSAGNKRGTFTVTDWWTLGWNAVGDWENYTRVFPSPGQDYVVFGHLASGGNPIIVAMDQITAGVGLDDTQQVKKRLGVFAPGRATAGWDSLEIFPLLTDTNGVTTTVNLAGTNTVRLTMEPGSAEDLDYIAFVPANHPVSITTQPFNRRAAPGSSNTVFTVGVTGPVLGFQWYTNGQQVAGAIGQNFTPVVTAANDGMKIHVVVTGKINSVMSSDATLTVGKLVTLRAAREQLWYNHIRDDVENGSLDTVAPDRDYSLSIFQTPLEQGDNYADRLSAIFVAPVTGNYVFFVNSDDDGDLFLSTDATPGNKQLICQETTWANPENWTGNDGGAAGAPDKRSDTFTGSLYPNGVPLVGGNQYYLEADHHEGGGGDFVEATYKLVGEPDPKTGQLSKINPFVMAPYVSGLDGAVINVTQQPQGGSAVEGRKFTFTAAATSSYIGDNSGASPGLFMQWQAAPKGSTTFTNIPGANGGSFTTPILALSNDGEQFRVAMISGDASTNTTAAVLAVIPDTFPPVPSVGTIKNNDGVIQVGVGFDEAVNPAGLVAGNFSLVGGGTITAFNAPTNSYGDYKGVLLNTTGLVPGTTYQVNVKNVADLKGNAIPAAGTNVSFTLGNMGWANTGTPINPGQLVIPVADGGVDILNGGRQEWGSYDEATIAYVKKTNDFDVKVQVIYAEPGSEWTRVGLMARNSLNVGEPTSERDTTTSPSTASAYAQTHVNPNETLGSSGRWDPNDPVQPVNTTPNNGHEQNCRLGTGTATSGWGSNVGTSPSYPDVWLRLKREGANHELLHGFRSTDGVTWVDQGTATLTDQQPDMFVGPFLAVETGNIWSGSIATGGFDVWNDPFDPKFDRLFVAQFRNFSDVSSGGNPTLSLKSNADGTFTLTFTGSLYSSTKADGPYAVVSGAVSPVTVNPKTAGPAATFYRAGP